MYILINCFTVDACDHAVVRFDEEEGCTSVVEDFRIQSDIKKLSEGDSCIVLWDDGVLYPATFVMAGKYTSITGVRRSLIHL